MPNQRRPGKEQRQEAVTEEQTDSHHSWLSPGAKSTSTTIQFNACETRSPEPFTSTVKGYALQTTSFRGLQGDFPPADPYIYCPNDPACDKHAASAVTISIFLTKSDEPIQINNGPL